jgi:hypothetical protein
MQSLAQKKARENFKKAIEYRKKTGCTLKQAFAYVKGKSTVVKKKATPKKVAVKKAAKKKVGVIKKKAAKKKVIKKPSEQSILNKIHKVKKDVENLDESQHKHMSGISMTNAIKHSYNEMLRREKKYLDVQKNIMEENVVLEHLKLRFKFSNISKEKKAILEQIRKSKTILSEYKTHAKELKKHI